MRGRDRKSEEDQARRRFNAVWPAAAPQSPADADVRDGYGTPPRSPADRPPSARPDAGVRPGVAEDAGPDSTPDGAAPPAARRPSADPDPAPRGTGPDAAPYRTGVDATSYRTGVDATSYRTGPDETSYGADVDADVYGAGLDGGGPIVPGRRVLGAFDPGRRGFRALLVVAALVVIVAALLAWRAQPRAEPVDRATVLAGPSEQAPSASPSAIVVAVQGKVSRPGLVRLAAGARVADAIEAAGGALPGVDLSYVNLARRLNDGELVVIGQTPPPGAVDGEPTEGGKVNLNSASLAGLETLPGIGPALAQRIVDYRTQHGGFHNVDELRQVSGIGDTKFASVKDLVTV